MARTKTTPGPAASASVKPIAPLAQSEARLEFALAASGTGYWEMDPVTRSLFGSDIYKANWGRKPDEPFSYETVRAAVHPDDLAMHEAAVDQALATRGNLDVEYRNIWPDGSVHWLRVRGHALYDDAGKPVRMAGISLDITDRKRVEETLREETHTLEVLHNVGVALAGDFNLQRIVQAVTDAATQLSGAQFGAFFHNVTNEKGESYMLYTLSGAPREAFSKFDMPRNTAVFNPTFQGTGIIRSDDITKDPRYGKTGPHFGMPKGHLPVASYLAVPVISRAGEVLGGLFFGHEKPGVFTPRVERIVGGIAAQAAIAMDNARLFQDAQNELAAMECDVAVGFGIGRLFGDVEGEFLVRDKLGHVFLDDDAVAEHALPVGADEVAAVRRLSRIRQAEPEDPIARPVWNLGKGEYVWPDLGRGRMDQDCIRDDRLLVTVIERFTERREHEQRKNG